MRRSSIVSRSLAILAMALLIVAIVGCGGGGGGNPAAGGIGAGDGGNSGGGGGTPAPGGGGITDPPKVRGVARIHSDAANPKIVLIDYCGITYPVIKPVSIERSSFGWQEKGFAVPTPAQPDRWMNYVFVVFNDKNNDNVYQVTERLGSGDAFLVWDPVPAKWQMCEKVGARVIRWPDAFTHTGKDNVFVDCTSTY